TALRGDAHRQRRRPRADGAGCCGGGPVTTPSVQWAQVAPEVILLISACVVIVTGSVSEGGGERRVSAVLSLVAFLGAGFAACVLFTQNDQLAMAGQLRADHFTQLVRVFIAAAGLLTVTTSWGTHRLDEHISEYYALLLTSAAGMSLLVAANGFV